MIASHSWPIASAGGVERRLVEQPVGRDQRLVVEDTGDGGVDRSAVGEFGRDDVTDAEPGRLGVLRRHQYRVDHLEVVASLADVVGELGEVGGDIGGVLGVLLAVLAMIIAAGGAVVAVAALIGAALVLGILLIVVGLGLV